MTHTIEILLVEDSPADVNLTIEALRDARVSYNIHVIGDGEDALKFLRREPPHENAPRPDFILLDLNLPRITGKQLLPTIKSDEQLMNIPVVVLSGSGDSGDIDWAYRNHVACYIKKSSQLDQFFAAVRTVKELWFHMASLPESKHASAADGKI